MVRHYDQFLDKKNNQKTNLTKFLMPYAILLLPGGHALSKKINISVGHQNSIPCTSVEDFFSFNFYNPILSFSSFHYLQPSFECIFVFLFRATEQSKPAREPALWNGQCCMSNLDQSCIHSKLKAMSMLFLFFFIMLWLFSKFHIH